MPEKKPVTGRLTADTLKRFETYRDTHELSQSDAVRRLIDKGLNTVEEEEGLVLVDPRTQAEQWCRHQWEQSGAAFFLFSGLTVVGLLVVYALGLFAPASGLIPQSVHQSLAIVTGLFFIVAIGSMIWAIIVWASFVTGIAQTIGEFLWKPRETPS